MRSWAACEGRNAQGCKPLHRVLCAFVLEKGCPYSENPTVVGIKFVEIPHVITETALRLPLVKTPILMKEGTMKADDDDHHQDDGS